MSVVTNSKKKRVKPSFTDYQTRGWGKRIQISKILNLVKIWILWKFDTVASYSNESFSFKWEWPILHPSPLCCTSFGWRKEANRKLLFEWKILIWKVHYSNSFLEIWFLENSNLFEKPNVEKYRKKDDLNLLNEQNYVTKAKKVNCQTTTTWTYTILWLCRFAAGKQKTV